MTHLASKKLARNRYNDVGKQLLAKQNFKTVDSPATAEGPVIGKLPAEMPSGPGVLLLFMVLRPDKILVPFASK